VPRCDGEPCRTNCVRCGYGAAAAAGFRAHRRRRRTASSSDVAVRSRSGAAYVDGCGAHLAGVVAHLAGRQRRGARCRPVRPGTARRRRMAVHSPRLRLRVSRGRAVDRRRTTPARVGACAANRRPPTAQVPHRWAVHRRRRRARRHDRRARDRADLTAVPRDLARSIGGARPATSSRPPASRRRQCHAGSIPAASTAAGNKVGRRSIVLKRDRGRCQESPDGSAGLPRLADQYVKSPMARSSRGGTLLHISDKKGGRK